MRNIRAQRIDAKLIIMVAEYDCGKASPLDEGGISVVSSASVGQ